MKSVDLKFDAQAVVSRLSRKRLLEMEEAGRTIKDCYRALAKAGDNVVGQVLKHQGKFYEMDHYPPGDVYDKATHSQYYYHAHRPESGEHGHFHTFIRKKGIPDHIKPAPYTGKAERPGGADSIGHFIAISMNRPGFPIGLFTINRWVAEDTHYAAEDLVQLLDRFEIDTTYPCYAVSRWITAMFRLFRPQIKELILARDEYLRYWMTQFPNIDVYEDRKLEVTSNLDIDVDAQLALVHAALGHERLSA